jgi:hypothetical protein
VASHGLSIYTPDGSTRLDDLNDFVSLECVLSEMQVGTLKIIVPATHNDTFFRRDARIAYYRTVGTGFGGLPRLVGDTAWVLAGRKRAIDRNNQEVVALTCAHPNHLLTRRVIAYAEKSAQADKSATAADDMIKAYVSENFVSATDTARNWAAARFGIESNLTAAPTVSKTASYRTVLTTCQEIAAMSAAAGTYLGFEVYSPTESGAFQLRTYTGQRGTDRSSGSNQPLILSIRAGSFSEIELDEQWMNIATFVYAGGTGQQDERMVGTAEDTALSGETPYGRAEWFQNAAQGDTAAVLNDAATHALRDHRPREMFTGAVVDTDRIVFMRDYNWGDRVVGEYARPDPYIGWIDVRQFDCRVDPVRIRVDRRANRATGITTETETLDIRLRSES